VFDNRSGNLQNLSCGTGEAGTGSSVNQPLLKLTPPENHPAAFFTYELANQEEGEVAGARRTYETLTISYSNWSSTCQTLTSERSSVQ
jgi:hypothetical protein